MTTHLVPGPAVKTVPFARELAVHGDRIALITESGEVSYRELGARVEAMVERLGTQRRLVLLHAASTMDSVVAYLAALAAGHPVLLASGDESLISAYDPDVVVSGDHIDERRAFSAYELHPDLALLLSTSGSTGSPKLVRLSHENLQANAESIARYLGISPADRAITTLPMQYCYGLSVINSHLLCGASLILTQLSVTDPQFWQLFTDQRATSFAAVPYTFELLDRVGFERKPLPHLRYVTQAGGRLAPDRVRHYAQLGQRDGWELFVMYGQTEATARMAYLPPHLAAEHPQCIGVPIPGGSFRLDPQTSELIYSGENVMLGYATTPGDLALGRAVHELHTGDIARRTPDGLYEIVGRKARFAKCFGLRIDLDRVELALRERGLDAYCAGVDELIVGVTGTPDTGRVGRLAARAAGPPVHAVRVYPLATVPRLASGKPDYQSIIAMANRAETETNDVAKLFAEVLDCPDVKQDDTFVSLGGDSLSYVETSIRLERMLGQLPDNWHTTPIRELRPVPAKRIRALDTSVALRAISIILIVGTHAKLFAIAGGAHLLLGVAGFNFARFNLSPGGRFERLRGMQKSIRRIAVPSMIWIGLVVALTGSYSLAEVFLVHYIANPKYINDFWFIETLVYILLGVLVLLALPYLDRAERRYPLMLPLILMGLGLITRYNLPPGSPLPTPLRGFWLFALGWAASKAKTWQQRLVVTMAILVTVPGFFPDLKREALIISGLVLLVWVPFLPSTSHVNWIAGGLASASLYIYLTHWQVHRSLAETSPLLALAASLVVGVVYGVAVKQLPKRLRIGALARRRGNP